MARLILPEYLLRHLAKGWQCSRCGERESVRLVYPRVVNEAGTIRLGFPWRCVCGQFGCLSVRMSILLFGYLMARVFLVELECRRRPTLDTLVHPGESGCFVYFLNGYAEALGRCLQGELGEDGATASVEDFGHLTGLRPPDVIERLLFLMPRPEWDAFLKRLGFDIPPDETPAA